MPPEPQARRAPQGRQPLMLTVRRWHGYIGALIAPSVLFFACTGALQLFSLHEAHGGYHPPALIEKLASVHKDQVFAAKAHHDDGPGEGQHAKGPPGKDHRSASKDSAKPIVLKVVFLGVAMGLITSTLFGLWMALQDPRRRRTTLALFALGVILPLVALLL